MCTSMQFLDVTQILELIVLGYIQLVSFSITSSSSGYKASHIEVNKLGLNEAKSFLAESQTCKNCLIYLWHIFGQQILAN